jgi:hypothetical protein
MHLHWAYLPKSSVIQRRHCVPLSNRSETKKEAKLLNQFQNEFFPFKQ